MGIDICQRRRNGNGGRHVGASLLRLQPHELNAQRKIQRADAELVTCGFFLHFPHHYPHQAARNRVLGFGQDVIMSLQRRLVAGIIGQGIGKRVQQFFRVQEQVTPFARGARV